MRLLRSSIHPDITSMEGSIFHRRAARAIILNGNNILMLYTERYHDYTLPGGGIDEGEEIHQGLIRELQEETGAQNIQNITDFGLYEEFRPWHKTDYEIIHMESYCFTCTINEELGDTAFESHEVQNGMKPVWINIYDAIAHNEQTIASSDKKGMSIERETFLLKRIVQELLTEVQQLRA